MPELQKAYGSWAKFFSVGSSFEIILKMMSQKYDKIYKFKSSKAINQFQNICFDKVNFGYQKEGKYVEVISNLNLKIKKGERIGIVGKSGSGKSTIANLIMGIFQPYNGEILVNNKNIHDINNKKIFFLSGEVVLHMYLKILIFLINLLLKILLLDFL